ncbi:hypothetical protein FHS85_004807 [Rhodoligotrophos appendicifer]|uniref:hypothetical protein n=1 Tax=Rhodoligotrophos appendicifer TaxID=987056 RepID=UPI00118578E2|nr:hypothetical protein [Rhodoligotrophos appendicifer]
MLNTPVPAAPRGLPGFIPGLDDPITRSMLCPGNAADPFLISLQSSSLDPSGNYELRRQLEHSIERAIALLDVLDGDPDIEDDDPDEDVDIDDDRDGSASEDTAEWRPVIRRRSSR